MNQQKAVEQLLAAVRDFLAATINDDSTEAALLDRMASASEIAVMVEVHPYPRIGIAGTDKGGRFAKAFELCARSRDLN